MTEMQLESRKDAIEIELNERLRRRHGDLKVKLEALAEPEGLESSSAETLEARTRELRSLINTIEVRNKKTAGKRVAPILIRMTPTPGRY
jgi:structural maintenance of chromosome 3 (chondroitin sulfate proteoglycan 6)